MICATGLYFGICLTRDILLIYWLNNFQNTKSVFLDPNYVRNDILWIFVGLIDEKIKLKLIF